MVDVVKFQHSWDTETGDGIVHGKPSIQRRHRDVVSDGSLENSCNGSASKLGPKKKSSTQEYDYQDLENTLIHLMMDSFSLYITARIESSIRWRST